jgi:hypothetical protein
MKVEADSVKWFVCFSMFLLLNSTVMYGQTTYVFTANSYSVLPVTIKINGQNYVMNGTNRYAKPGSHDAVTVILYGNNNSWIAYDKDGDVMTNYERVVVYKEGIKQDERNQSTISYIRIILKGQTKRVRSDSKPEIPDPDIGSGEFEYPEEVADDENQEMINPDINNANNRGQTGDDSSWKGIAVNAIGDLGTIYGDAIIRGMNISMDGFPYLAIHVGYNRFNDFSFGVKYRSNGFTGMSVFANCGFMKKGYGLPWDVGLGLCFQDFAFDMRFGNTNLSPNYGLMVDLTYDWYFVDNLGIAFVAGLGFGDTKKKEPDVIWNLGIALSFKLWSR